MMYTWNFIVLFIQTYLLHDILVHATYVSPILNYSTPQFPIGQRTAIILSGQLRSGNLSWWTGDIRIDKSRLMFGTDDPATPIQTVLEWLITPYALYGGVDMFVYIQVDRAHMNSSYVWDGNPSHYEHTLGDMRMCEIYAKHPIFHAATGNKVFCNTEYEHQVSNQFTEQYAFWKDQLAKEILLQQLYGIYRGNMAAKQYSLASGVQYRYKIRLRPDLAVVKPMPLPHAINFNSTKPGCPHTVYYPNGVIFPQGAEDSFNIGEVDDMDHLLDRYVDITTKPFIFRNWRDHHYWNSESYLAAVMEERYHTCFQSYNDIWMVVIRKADHQTHYNKDPVAGFMERIEDLKKIAKLYEQAVDIPSSSIESHVPHHRREREISPFMQIAIRISMAVKNNENSLIRMKKLCERKEFSNDPSIELRDLTDKFHTHVMLVKQDLSILKSKSEEKNFQAHEAQHYKIMIETLTKLLSTQVNSFKEYADSHAQNLKQRHERVAQYGQRDLHLGSLAQQQQQYAMFASYTFTPVPHHDDTSSSSSAAAASSSSSSMISSSSLSSSNISLRRRTHVSATGRHHAGYMGSAEVLEGERSQQQQQAMMRNDKQYKEGRLSNAQRIEASITQMGEMFSQLSTLVLQQSETITRIEDDVEIGLQETEKANKHMQKFYEISKGNRSMILKIFTLLIFFIFLFLYFT